MTLATDQDTFNTDQDAFKKEDYDKYYKRACEVCVPIVLKIPVYVAPIVIEKEPKCVEKNGY
ncbi:MAG: hypothetical protein LDL41_17770 [Coleofasciculus sp. S288]|nr:hypothetical protein [Coleofasciculus sp. S288]